MPPGAKGASRERFTCPTPNWPSAREIAPELTTPIVVYCWGPGCNGSTRGALTLATLGYTRVRELIGGFEYWAREGLAVVSDSGRSRQAPDPLTAPVTAPAQP